jgi:2-C-methyl-D-erythritol 4-phosphate cytidylyltransferase
MIPNGMNMTINIQKNHTKIIKAYEKAKKEFFQATDDAGIVEKLPHPIKIVEGSPLNIKIWLILFSSLLS